MQGLERDTLFVALTRPQMFAGVTYSYFIANAVIATELFLIFRSFWVLLAALLIHARRRGAVRARAALLRSLADPGRPLPAGQEPRDLAMQLLPALTRDAQDRRPREAGRQAICLTRGTSTTIRSRRATAC